MTTEEAKEILMLYRPATADAFDPAFTEALELADRDPELKRWFAHHCALYTALRSKFKQISVPEGLKEQIIAERRVHSMPIWQKLVLAGGAVAAAALMIFSMDQYWRPHEPHDFATYRESMTGFAIRGYGMDTNTTDLDAIRLYLAQKNAIADYVLPEDLRKNAAAAGCVATTWQGKNVSMICFRTGRPLAAGRESDLWLFIADPVVAKGTPASSTPILEKGNGISTASWTVGNRTYVLATEGDEQFLRKFL
jgi:hypothetical protein